MKLGRYTARATRRERRHDVHTRAVLTVPASRMRTDWRFGSQRRRVLCIEWLTLLPDAGPLPQTSHRLATNLYPRLKMIADSLL